MKCQACGYVSLDDLPKCKKCGAELKREDTSFLTYEWEERPPDDDFGDGVREAGWRVGEVSAEEEEPVVQVDLTKRVTGPSPGEGGAPAASPPPSRPAPVRSPASTAPRPVRPQSPPKVRPADPPARTAVDDLSGLLDSLNPVGAGSVEPAPAVIQAPPALAPSPPTSPASPGVGRKEVAPKPPPPKEEEKPFVAPAPPPPVEESGPTSAEAFPAPLTEEPEEAPAAAAPAEAAPEAAALPPPPPESSHGGTRMVPPAGEVVLDDLRIELEEPPVDLLPPPRREEPAQLVFLQEEEPPLEDVEEIPEDYRGDPTAGFGRRAVALVADVALIAGTLVLYLAGAGVGLALKGVRPLWLLSNPWPADALLPFLLLSLLVGGVFSVWGTWRSGRTPGKRLAGLRVIHETGRPLTFGESVGRWIGSLVAGIPLMIGFLWALVDDEGRGWHDRLAGTRVVQVRRPGRADQRPA